MEFVNRSELGDRASQRVDAGRERTIERAAKLPGRKGRDVVVTAVKMEPVESKMG